MAALKQDYLVRCREILLRCAHFASDESLQTVFVAGELYILQHRLPKAISKADRVDRTIAYLLDSPLGNGQPALGAFLAALCDRSDNDYLADELRQLHAMLPQALIELEIEPEAESLTERPTVALLLSQKMLALLDDGVPAFVRDAIHEAGCKTHTSFTEDIQRSDLRSISTTLESFPVIVADISGFDPLVLLVATIAVMNNSRIALLYNGDADRVPDALRQQNSHSVFIKYRDKAQGLNSLKKALIKVLSTWLVDPHIHAELQQTNRTTDSRLPLVDGETMSVASPIPANPLASLTGFEHEYDLLDLECKRKLAKEVRMRLHDAEVAQIELNDNTDKTHVQRLKDTLADLRAEIQELEARTRHYELPQYRTDRIQW